MIKCQGYSILKGFKKNLTKYLEVLQVQVVGLKMECNKDEFELDPEGQRLTDLINCHLPHEV